MSSGKSKGSLNRETLGKRDRSILADAVRFRLTTNEFIQVQYLPDAVPNAVSKITSRLVAGGWLSRQTLYDNRNYFVPSKRLCQQFGLPVSRCRPLGPQTLATNVSIAAYCHRSTPRYRRIDQNDFANVWSWVPEKLRTLPCATDLNAELPALRLLRVDLGGTPTHVAMKCHHDMKVRSNVTGYRKLLGERRLVLVVLTTTENKKDLLVRALKTHSWPENTRLEIFVVPELCNLITS